jgi:putative transposase
MISYHDLRSISPEKARQIIRKVLEHTQGNVSKTARILKTSRHTIRRARDGSLEDLSRKPHRCPRKTPTDFERLITSEGKRTGFRYRRLTAYLRRKFGLVFSENTLKAILRRNHVKKRTRRSTNGQRRHLYDYEALHPFGEFQLDTKHLLDQRALPREVYHHMKSSGIPRYEWHLMDVATRARFTAYSHELSATQHRYWPIPGFFQP